MANQLFTTYTFPITGGSVDRTTPDRFADIINVKEFGAIGNGTADDTAAIQAAFDAAFGPPESPHGNTNRALNKPVFLPGGNYRITSPLYLIGIQGGMIFGNGTESTTLSFESPGTGNSVIPTGDGSEITPCIMTNGISYTRIEGMTIGSNSSSNTAGIYLFTDGTFLSTADIFSNLLISGFTNGILGGYGGSGGNCDNMQFHNVVFTLCTLAGLRVVGQNALNYGVYGGGGSSCCSTSTGPGGNRGAVYSAVGGSISPICGASFSGNEWDIISGSASSVSIIGASSESQKCIGMAGTACHVSGVSYRPVNSSGCKFVDCTYTGMAKIDSCHFSPGNDTGAGTIVELGNIGIAVVDALYMGDGGVSCVYSGTAGSKLYLRGSRDFSGSAPLTGFGGTVAQNI